MLKYIKILLPIFLLSSCLSNTSNNSFDQGKIGSWSKDIKPYIIGSVDTSFKLIGPDHKIELWGVPDPKIEGITCFYSRAKFGWISWAIGIAEDTSDASVACRQTGKINFIEAIGESEEIWSKDTSIFFKSLQIVRFYDKNSNSLIYLVYSDKLIDGSPKNSISAVALDGIIPKLK